MFIPKRVIVLSVFLLVPSFFASGANLPTVRGKCMSDATYANVSIFLAAANEAAIAKNNVKAIEILDRGIVELGNHYAAKDTIDDTSLKLTLAQLKQTQGDMEQAVNLKKSVLASRLELYKKKISCE